jgi:hypothetical protein
MHLFKFYIKKLLNMNCKNFSLWKKNILFGIFFSYPNADELRSIVNRLVDRYPHCISVIGSIELLVRKLYYKFCNERKKYPIELKRRQPNKRKRQENLSNDFHHSSLDHLMHLWTTTTHQQSCSSSNSSSPILNNQDDYHPLNLSISTE